MSIHEVTTVRFARCLAKRMLCAATDGRTDADACNACETCTQTERGLNLDVVELDGRAARDADIERLAYAADFPPARDRAKVMILMAGGANKRMRTRLSDMAVSGDRPWTQFIFVTRDYANKRRRQAKRGGL